MHIGKIIHSLVLALILLTPDMSIANGDGEHSHGEPAGKKIEALKTPSDIRLMKTGKDFEIVLKFADPDNPQLIVYVTDPESNLPISDAIVTLTVGENTELIINKTDKIGVFNEFVNEMDDKNISISIKKENFEEIFNFDKVNFQKKSDNFSNLTYILLFSILLLSSILFLKKYLRISKSHISLVFIISNILLVPVFAHVEEDHIDEENSHEEQKPEDDNSTQHQNAKHNPNDLKIPHLVSKDRSAITIPKELQLHLNMTTEKVVTRSLKQTIRLIGQVVSNPSGYARLQASQNARVLNDPDFPLPLPGQKVQKDQVILSLQPTIGKIETSVEKTALYKIESEIDQLRKDVARKEKLGQYVAKKDLEIAKSELERALKQKDEIISKTFKPEYLKSPLEGIISDLHVRPGEIVTPDKTIVEIVDPSKLMIEALLFDSSLSDDIVKGFARLPLTPDKNIPLELLGVSPKVNKEDQAVHILFKVLETDPSIKLDMVIEVIAELKASKETLTIPKSAINEDRTGSWVFVKINPETFEPRKVHINRYINQFAEIAEGLNVDEIIVVSGSYLLNEAR